MRLGIELLDYCRMDLPGARRPFGRPDRTRRVKSHGHRSPVWALRLTRITALIDTNSNPPCLVGVAHRPAATRPVRVHKNARRMPFSLAGQSSNEGRQTCLLMNRHGIAEGEWRVTLPRTGYKIPGPPRARIRPLIVDFVNTFVTLEVRWTRVSVAAAGAPASALEGLHHDRGHTHVHAAAYPERHRRCIS
jgi:hypothetical protein